MGDTGYVNLGVFFNLLCPLLAFWQDSPNAKGTAFGLASFSLAVGALPAPHSNWSILRCSSGISLVLALMLGVGLTLVKDSRLSRPFGHERCSRQHKGWGCREDVLIAEPSDQVDELAAEDEVWLKTNKQKANGDQIFLLPYFDNRYSTFAFCLILTIELIVAKSSWALLMTIKALLIIVAARVFTNSPAVLSQAPLLMWLQRRSVLRAS